MKTMIKSIIAIAAAVAMAFGAWADTATVNGITWTYTISNGEASLGGGNSSSTAVPTSTTGTITIPSKLGGYAVTSIRDGAFYNCNGLTNIVIPDNVTRIGVSAFSGCSNLTNVTIGNGVTRIGRRTFYNCTNLTSVTIGDGVTIIEEEAFYGCNDSLFDTTTIPYVKLVDGWAVGRSNWLLGDLNLTGIRGIGDYAFYNSGLTSVTIPNSVTNIARGAFSHCGCLMSVSFPDSVTSIGSDAFRYSLLQSVTIPDSVTSIEDCAFENCISLTNVVVGNGVSNIGDGAFNGCNGLVSISVESGNANYKSLNGLLLSRDGTELIVGINGDVTIPDAVMSIGTSAFQRRCGLTSLTIPSSVTNIGYLSFKDCKGLTNMIFEGDAPLASDYAFSGVGNECSAHIRRLSSGWGINVPGNWKGLPIDYIDQIVIFEANGGKGGISNILDRGSALVAPMVSREGYTFMGWQPVLPETVQAGDATYTAQWLINQYMVTFDANGGVGGKSGKQDYGSAIAAPTVTREGYTFTGWTPEVTETVPTNDVTYTAQWQINQYTVTFNANGGRGGTIKTQNYGTSLSAPTVTRMGYTFTGWLPNVPSTMPAENMTYTAQWQINQYTATFNANGGTGGTTKMQNYGTSLTAPTVTRDGYTFRGWAPSVPSAMPAENETYTAQWEVQYTVTFNANGGMGGWSKKLDRGSALVAPTVTREWFEPAGWQPVVPATVPANDVTYTAQWWRRGDSISASEMDGKTMKHLYPNDYDHMTEVVLEEGVTELPEGFFDGCEALVELTLPSTLEEFGLDDLPPRIKERQAFDDDGFMVYKGWILGCNDDYLEELVVPEGIVGIGRGAFQEQFSLLRVTFPFSMRSVSANAFLGCVSLNELNANSGLRHVGDSAFEDCISLPVLELVDGLVSIGTCAFKNNAQLNSVRLPLSVGNIAADAFLECAAVRGVILPTKVRPLSALFPESYAQIEDVEVVAGETEIMTGMFAGCRSLRSVQLAESVTNLGAYAFQECTALSEIVLPDGVESMGPGVFRGCSSLAGITLSSVLTVISDEAFLGCTSLASLIVPASVSYLGRSFFSGHEVHYQGNAPDHDENAYPSGLGDLRSFALTGTKGWYAKYPGAAILPPDRSWCGYPIAYEVPPVFDVTFVANGGQFANGEAEYPVSQRTGNKYVFPADPARPGWIFMGWRRMADGGAEIIPGKTDVTATASHRVYADWQSMDERVTVAFNANGGTEVEPREYVPGLTYGGFPVPTRTGYKFQGWWTAAGIEVTEASEVAESVRVLTAHWLPISYIVRFLANGADNPVEMMHQPFTYDARQRLWTNRFERTGFNFAGWAVRPDGDVKYTDCEEVANLAQKQGTVVDLHAVWHGEGYSVQFKAMGGEGRMEPQTIRIGETRALWSNVFTKEGYVFAGWDVDERGTNVVYRDAEEVLNLSLTNRDDVPLYAVWKRRDETATIMFNANGGSVAPVYWGCVVGTTVEAFPLPSRPGFDFAGWYTAITNGELVSAVNPVTKDEVYYAHWVETGIIVPGPAICTAMFNANGGSLGTNAITVAVTAGSAIGALPMPARIGHVFTGWFTAADGGIQVSPETVVDSSVTYYAHWESDGQQGSSYVVPASVTGSAAIEISADWPRMFGAFEEKFGTDIAEALQKTTGKLNADGSPLHVWQDYVAGTDPTDTNSVFRVQIKMNATVPEISWTPDLNTRGLERIYTIWGKESLMDGAWTTPTNSAHRFFKVTVEMP